MENEEMLEHANETENVDTQTTEENVDGIELTDTTDTESVEEKEEVKMFTQEEVNEIVERRIARQDKEHQKELSKYKNAESVLNAGLGTKSIDEAETQLRSFWKEQGIEIPEPVKQGLSEQELQRLGQGDAEDILKLGLEEARIEADKLAQKGHQNWNVREQATFQKLASVLTYEKQKQELKSIGVDSKILDSDDFKEFASQFNMNADIKKIYNLYSKNESKKEFTKLGSMKNNTPEKVEKKYTSEEIDGLSLEDLDNDEVWNAVRKSMTEK